VPTIVPFRAWRYDLDKGGPLERLIAPPYDVIGPELQRDLYERSPVNIVRVDLGLEYPDDNASSNRYTRAAASLDEWRRSGVLVRDTEPGITVIEETFAGPDGRTRTRRGFLACLKLESFDEGGVYPHETTLSGPKEDRFRLMRATEMSLSPVFMLYSLPGDAVMAAWERNADAAPFATIASEKGVVIRVWPTSRPEVLGAMNRALADVRLLIADGHHRYETALRYRDTVGAENPGYKNGAWEYALVYLVNMEDPGLAIFGTHRLVRSVPLEQILALPQSLGHAFHVEHLSDNAGDAPAAISSFLDTHADGPTALGLFIAETRASYGLVLKADPLSLSAGEGDAGSSPAYRRLDVTVLQKGVLEPLLSITPEDITAGTHVSFFKETDEAFRALAAGEYQAGFFMNATKLSEVKEIALTGERMPQKSTYFYPKLPTGLVLHDLHGTL
jgi:uncharacterized protein (DUF1015 family)